MEESDAETQEQQTDALGLVYLQMRQTADKVNAVGQWYSSKLAQANSKITELAQLNTHRLWQLDDMQKKHETQLAELRERLGACEAENKTLQRQAQWNQFEHTRACALIATYQDTVCVLNREIEHLRKEITQHHRN